MHSKNRRGSARSLFSWAHHRQNVLERGVAAQAALDIAEEETPKKAHGSLYRAGVSLAELNPGECGTIRLLVATVQARLRLMEMGLTPGTHVRVVRAAAFGGPLDVLVRGYQLSLRREEAMAIHLGEDGDDVE